MPANLEQFSDALAAHAAAARGAVAAIRLSETRHLTGTLWRPDVVVASEQSLPRRDEFELIVAGGSVVNAKLAGRDPGTNVAALGGCADADPHAAASASRPAASDKGRYSRTHENRKSQPQYQGHFEATLLAWPLGR
jgi:hypothetical protein